MQFKKKIDYVSVGGDSMCVITTSKLLYCWDKERKLKEIVLNKKFKSVAHGYRYFCAIDVNGKV